MKLTIVANKPDGAHQLELQAAARARGINAPIRNISRENLTRGEAPEILEGAVIWRSSDLDITSERTSLLPLLETKTAVASMGVFRYPMLRFKYFQQQVLAANAATAQWSIPTFRCKNAAALQLSVDAGELKLPVIAKPNAGAWGEGIALLHNTSDISQLGKPLDYVFQSFIPNDCDWRVIVVGGTPLGFLRRQAAPDSFLNNISQGATAAIETDQELCNQLAKIATKVASLFSLSFCGVDIIRDRTTGKLYVLEVNSAPQWGDDYGFKRVVGVDVPGKVIDWVVARESAAASNLPDAVQQYYQDRFDTLRTDAFHFASRLWLWTGSDWARQRLDELQEGFIGTTPEAIEATILRTIEKAKTKPLSVNQQKTYRKEPFTQYPELPLYNALLFKAIWCDSVYGLDIRPYIRKHISDKTFLQFFDRLVNDADSIRLLSTHAVNFFYLLKNYFKPTLSLSNAVQVSPYELLDLLPGYAGLERRGVIDRRASLKLQIYLLTHAIIGESRFYARDARREVFRQLCARIEQLISDNYYDVSLDNKFEFLVCAELCGYQPRLRSQIEQEAAQSVSWAGNFLVDTLNSFADSAVRHSLGSSEHRNVLYLMSQRPFVRHGSIAQSTPAKQPEAIGRLARISLPAYDVRRLIARVDSGAGRSAIAASNVFEDEAGLHFTLFDSKSPFYTGKEYVVKKYERTSVKNTALQQERYAIEVELVMDDRPFKLMVTLADRAHMLYPMLLGRNFLTGRYVVDTSKQFIRPGVH